MNNLILRRFMVCCNNYIELKIKMEKYLHNKFQINYFVKKIYDVIMVVCAMIIIIPVIIFGCNVYVIIHTMFAIWTKKVVNLLNLPINMPFVLLLS